MANDNLAIRLQDLLDMSSISNPDYEKVLVYLAELTEELKTLSATMASQPLEMLEKNYKDLADGMSKLSTVAISTNQATKEGAGALTSLFMNMENVNREIKELIQSKKALSSSTLEAEGRIRGFEKAIKDAAAEQAKLSANGKDNSERFQELARVITTATLGLEKLRNETKEVAVEVKQSTGYFEGLKIMVGELKKQMDALSESDAKNVEIGGVLNKQIQNLNTLITENKQKQDALNTTLTAQTNIVKELAAVEAKLEVVLSDENMELAKKKALLAEINKELALDSSPEKKIELMQKAQAQRKLILEKEQEMKEKALIKEQELEDAANKKSLDASINRYEQETALIDKMLAQQAKRVEELDKLEDAQNRKELDNELKKVEAREASHLKSKQNYIDEEGSINKVKERLNQLKLEWYSMSAASRGANQEMRKEIIETTRTVEELEMQTTKTKFQMTVLGKAWESLTMFFRYVPGFFAFGILFTAMSKLWELIDLGTKKTQEARKELEDYNQKLRDISASAAGDAAKDIANMEILIARSRDLNLTYAQRVDAIAELRKSHEGLMKDLTDEKIMYENITELKKKMSKEIMLEASLKAVSSKVGASAERAVKAQFEMEDVQGVVKKAEIYKRKRLDELEAEHPNWANMYSKTRTLKGYGLKLTQDQVEYIKLRNDEVDIDKIFDNTDEGRKAKQRLKNRGLVDKIFDVGVIRINEQKDIIEDKKRIIEEEKLAREEYLEKASQIGLELSKSRGGEKKYNLARFEADLQVVQDRIETYDLGPLMQKYGTSREKITEQDVFKMRDDINDEIAKDLNEVLRLKRVISALKGSIDRRTGGKKGADPLSRELKTERDLTRDNQEKLREDFDSNNPYNTYEDEIKFHEKQKDEAEMHYEAMLFIREKYKKTKWMNDERWKQIELEADKEKLAVQNKANEAQNAIFEERRRKTNEAISQIEDYNRRLEKQNRELDIIKEKYGLSVERGRIGVKRAKHVNVISSTIGAEDEGFNFKAQQDDLQAQIDEKQREIERTKEDRFRTATDLFKSKSELDDLGTGLRGNTYAEKYKNSQYDNTDKSNEFRLKYQQHNKNEIELINLDAKLFQQQADLQKQKDEKEMTAEQRKADAKKRMIQQTFDFGVNIANREMDLQKQRIQMQMQNMQASYSLQLELAGNNSAARQRIAREQTREMKRLRREEAKTEKQAAIFAAIIATYQGVAAAISKGPPQSIPLSAMALAMGLANVAQISSRPLPSYRKGRRGGLEEVARVNEEGAEIIESKHGKLRIAGDGRETITHLEEGDIVHTHKQSLDLLGTDSFVKSLAKGAQSYVDKERNDKRELVKMIGNQLTKKDYQDAFERAIEKMPTPSIQIPADAVLKLWDNQQRRNGLK